MISFPQVFGTSRFVGQAPKESRFFEQPIHLAENPNVEYLTTTMDCERGARLLLNFKTIATEEFQKTHVEIPPLRKNLPKIASLIPSPWDGSDGTEEEAPSHMKRLRTVSVSFDEPPMSPLPASPTHSFDTGSVTSTIGSPRYERSLAEVTPEVRKRVIDLPENLKQVEAILDRPAPSKLVGTAVKGPVKAVLQRKFSWKNFPALEAYLVKHREEYLQFSSELNYTAEQKRYNNQLTQGLLDLAEEEGYLFEDFTFAAIRDRIRCYYKSYVQATKKKKKRKRGSF